MAGSLTSPFNLKTRAKVKEKWKAVRVLEIKLHFHVARRSSSLMLVLS
jgi:hypothetical protein